jgi:hypothetical protein
MKLVHKVYEPVIIQDNKTQKFSEIIMEEYEKLPDADKQKVRQAVGLGIGMAFGFLSILQNRK